MTKRQMPHQNQPFAYQGTPDMLARLRHSMPMAEAKVPMTMRTMPDPHSAREPSGPSLLVDMSSDLVRLLKLECKSRPPVGSSCGGGGCCRLEALACRDEVA